ncbi:hypothetical protein AQUCO_02400059v1 [Aquilegia coerulea]|uniref:Uncharacterized protein n=1 Tax=Aquilegia coerulea TaxID=218851 RepID=A0A2G5DB54_AQUCA|nr:hypothetical protein AQUCO_02400059v1 [Aquilegia coerulea]
MGYPIVTHSYSQLKQEIEIDRMSTSLVNISSKCTPKEVVKISEFCDKHNIPHTMFPFQISDDEDGGLVEGENLNSKTHEIYNLSYLEFYSNCLKSTDRFLVFVDEFGNKEEELEQVNKILRSNGIIWEEVHGGYYQITEKVRRDLKRKMKTEKKMKKRNANNKNKFKTSSKQSNLICCPH